MPNTLWFDKLGMQDLQQVGGKIASLGEMINHLQPVGVKVPRGFATTVEAYQLFLQQNNLSSEIAQELATLDVTNLQQLQKIARSIRAKIFATPFLPDFTEEVSLMYQQLQQSCGADVLLAVRSSATAEDLPEASFAGQQETLLNVAGLDELFQSIKHVFASLYNESAICYRVHHGFQHEQVLLAVGIQQMVRSDLASSGVMFSIDTESGFEKVVLISASYGLGETIVQGNVNPDEYYVYKPNLSSGLPAILRRNLGKKDVKTIFDAKSRIRKVLVPDREKNVFCLNNEEVEALARLAVAIENHYQKPMDIEWGKDGITSELFILQARPETVKSRADRNVLERYQIATHGSVITTGRSVGQKIGQGKAKILLDLTNMETLNQGDVLVTDMTDPDWEPIMKKASAIVTNRGGRTCHAAIIARELGIPAVVGCENATIKITNDEEITVSCAEGETGFIYHGLLPFEIQKIKIDALPELPLKLMLNIGNPERAFDFQFLPNSGVGLARLEFIINNMIGIHPKALLQYESLSDPLKAQIQERIVAYTSPTEFYVDRLKEGIATIAAAFYPKPIIIRFSDFKTNEYANLIGGQLFEPKEENPMLGYRGACRYVSKLFSDCFELEVKAVKRAREDMGLDNIWVMVPFVRTLKEAQEVTQLLAGLGLKSGEKQLKVIMMCEIPSNALLADAFLQYFDGFSIGSNDLTQLTLGVDRDSGIVANLFDERDEAVKALLKMAIVACKKANKYIGICGQGPSDHPDFARWLIDMGIESISLNPDTIITTWAQLNMHINNPQGSVANNLLETLAEGQVDA